MELPKSSGSGPDRHLAAVLLHLLAACYDVRLQFADWWEFEPPYANAELLFFTRSGELAQLLHNAMSAAQRLKPPQLAALVAVLNLHGRILGMEAAWQQFAWQYAVVDGCWKILFDLGKLPDVKRANTGHGQRLERLDKLVGGRAPQDHLTNLCGRRNHLMHECLEEGQVVDSGRGAATISGYLDLRQLSLQLVLTVLEVDCGFRITTWTCTASMCRDGLDLAGWQRPTH